MARDRRGRNEKVLAIVTELGQVSVADIAERTRSSEVTVRSALRDLESMGLLRRTWGGAQSLQYKEENPLARLHKLRIAELAASLVSNGDRIMLDSSETASLIVPNLANLSGVEIVTNSKRAFEYASKMENLRVVVTGGLLDRHNSAFVGAVAWKGVRAFRAKYAFIGAQGFDVRHGVVTEFGGGAEVVAAMHEAAEETWLVADSSKYGASASLGVLGLESLSGIIVDDELPSAACREVENVVPKLILA